MASVPGCKVTLLTIVWLRLFLVTEAASTAIDLNITSVWKPELGWEVSCSWQTLPNDTLQSVRLQNNGQQFMIYRPEIHGESRSEVFTTPDNVMSIDCSFIAIKGRQGRCVLTVEPYKPPNIDFTFTCEVSGERPTFMIGKKDYIVKTVVPPSDAKLEYKTNEAVSPGRVMLNCTSTGLPAPNLQWTIDEDKVQADFTGRMWNVTSKLWHVWSSLSYSRSDQSASVSCTPEVHSHEEIIKGTPAMYNAANVIGITKSMIVFIALVLLR